jgi:hypothetical protein
MWREHWEKFYAYIPTGGPESAEMGPNSVQCVLYCKAVCAVLCAVSDEQEQRWARLSSAQLPYGCTVAAYEDSAAPAE